MKDTEIVSPGNHSASFRAASRIALGFTEGDGRPSSPNSSVHNLISERLRVSGVVDNSAGGGGGGRTFVNVHHVRSLARASNRVIWAMACKSGVNSYVNNGVAVAIYRSSYLVVAQVPEVDNVVRGNAVNDIPRSEVI
jgi:hypothetical protein